MNGKIKGCLPCPENILITMLALSIYIKTFIFLIINVSHFFIFRSYPYFLTGKSDPKFQNILHAVSAHFRIIPFPIDLQTAHAHNRKCRQEAFFVLCAYCFSYIYLKRSVRQQILPLSQESSSFFPLSLHRVSCRLYTRL